MRKYLSFAVAAFATGGAIIAAAGAANAATASEGWKAAPWLASSPVAMHAMPWSADHDNGLEGLCGFQKDAQHVGQIDSDLIQKLCLGDSDEPSGVHHVPGPPPCPQVCPPAAPTPPTPPVPPPPPVTPPHHHHHHHHPCPPVPTPPPVPCPPPVTCPPPVPSPPPVPCPPPPPNHCPPGGDPAPMAHAPGAGHTAGLPILGALGGLL